MTTDQALTALETKAANAITKYGPDGMPVTTWASIIAGQRVEVRNTLSTPTRYFLATVDGDGLETTDRVAALRFLGV